jgi:Zn-dependent protease
MNKLFRELYGTGIIFFYYIKWIIFIGLPILYFGLDYKQNIIMDILWVYCFALITKDFIMRVVLKKKYCDIDISKKK